MEEIIKQVEYCCPKCNKQNIIKIEFDELYNGEVLQFDFECANGCKYKFKYQYGNISCNGEMSTYKNKYTNSIMIEVSRIVRQLYDEMRLDTTKR